MKPKNNEELKKMIKDGVINCKGKDLICDFNIDVEADIINARNITAGNITARNITARNINAWDIDAVNINARNITARNINAWDIDALDINARNITARNINAWDISYYAVCFAYNNIKCESIKGRRENSKHFALDGKIIMIKREK